MKNKRHRVSRAWILCFLVGSIISFSQCSKTTSGDDAQGTNIVLSITDVSLPSSIHVHENGDIKLTARGFDTGDEIIMTSTENSNIEYTLPLKSVTAQSGVITLPAGFSSGSYRLVVRRNNRTATLGTVHIQLVVDIPDQAGMNIKGMVESDGVGIPNVVVSDGIEVTTTNEQGIYYLNSAKKHGYVFISVPSNYEVSKKGNLPQFFQYTTSPQTSVIERMDFSLTPVNNAKHIVLAMADFHLAARGTNDIFQFENGFLPDANQTISTYQSQGYKVYGLTLGDLTWETYWYSTNFRLPEYITQIGRLNCPVFNVIGNHDHDPYYADDWFAENAYRRNLGPTYYSFNLGDIHYVVLDNTEYINTGGAVGSPGQRNYNSRISNEQLEWLQKDLATVQDKNKPLVLAMHIPLLNAPGLDGNGNETGGIRVTGGTRLINEILSAFSDVHVLSGHSHINWTRQYSPTLVEHNIGAVSASWWWTGFYGDNHICRDGSPGGYKVFNRDNNDFTWYYKGIGFDKDYQFRAYDRNEIHITAAEFAPNSTNAELAPYVGEFASASSDNEILVNVFGYDTEWSIEILEEGNPLPVTRVSTFDPLHAISYAPQRLNLGHTPNSTFVSNITRHIFKATASNAMSTVQINVTDRFGRVYTETMTRPKPFNYSMR